MSERIYLSSPHMGESERGFVTEAFDTNWVAPIGPHVDGFEKEFAEYVGASHAVAVTSGTAALHLALRLSGLGDGDEALVSTFTFCASVNPILYQNARPVFVDSEAKSWNLDPNLLEEVLRQRASVNKVPKALVLVHLYGQSADTDPIHALCEEYGVALVEDAAEALGATYHGRSPGIAGKAGIYSFNGNKIITTSGGGMLVTDDGDLAAHARKLATQARDPAPHYQHSEIGYNYRLSNVLAGIGRGQLMVLEDRVQARRAVFDRYVSELGDLDAISFAPEMEWGRHTRWLSCLMIDPAANVSPDDIRLALESEDIEARPLWKPMHLQPAYEQYESHGGAVAEALFDKGLCLPSGSNLRPDQQARVIDVVRQTVAAQA